MPDETGKISSSKEPEPVAPDRRHILVRLWDNGIPLWQKLVVWVGAASVTWITLLGSSMMLATTMRGFPIFPLVAVSLALSAGLWLWPMTGGRSRIVALVLSVPATLEFLIFSPASWIYWEVSVSGLSWNLADDLSSWLGLITPVLAYAALAVVWFRAIRDFRASRRARRTQRSA